MRRRVFVVAGEYSANPRHLPPERRGRGYFAQPHGELSREEVSRVFFRFPNRGDDARTRPEDWQRAFGISSPVALTDLFASAAHRALTSLNALQGCGYQRTLDSITDVFVTSMPGLEPNERMNIGLVPQALRAVLGLPPRARAQFVVGTSDSGAWAFAQAVRAARNAERPATILVVAGQVIPSGYASQYQIRTVLGEDDQAHGLDMLAVGDLIMDAMRRNLGLQTQELQRFLERVAARKHQAGAHYPAGISAGKPFKREAQRTPWFDASDIAVPCCGAAATIVTSDEELAQAIAATRSPRFRTAPVTEVLGVGEGSSNHDLLHRKSPLLFTTAVREALADTADDARVPLSTYASCAFGVVHDAFPSIELSFLLSLGLGWERSAERMAEGWSNPAGGLLSFGHALGASGLVQVNKAHHLFCVDQRYIVEQQGRRRQGFREEGALAFATSVGGPLSHIVATLFRGGYDLLRPRRERPGDRRTDALATPATAAWRARRHQLRLVLPGYLRGLPGLALVEGATWVSIRSCLRALSQEEIARLLFEGLEQLIAPAQLDHVRQRLRNAVFVAQMESERLASMFDVFRLLTDEVREIAAEVVARHGSRATGETADKLAERLKECLRVPLAILCTTEGRVVRFQPPPEVAGAQLVNAQTLQPADGPLPFWNARATRPALPAQALPAQAVDAIIEQPGGPRTGAELQLLRLWFTPDPPRVLLEEALRAAGGAPAAPAASVRTVFYLAEIQEGASELAHELFGTLAREARAYLDAYESSVAQVGPALFAVAFERPPFRAGADEALLSAARFAHEVARGARQHGLVVRAAICLGEGAVYEDVNGQPAVASPVAARAAALLQEVRKAPGTAFAIEGASALLLSLLDQRLTGWRRGEGPLGSALFAVA